MTGRRSALATIGIGTAVIFGLAAAGHLGGLRLNLTPSYALGLWRIESLSRPAAVGDMVFVCPPQAPAFALALERGYLRRGLCPGWMSPLIKTVVATQGQRVEIDGAVSVEGTPIVGSEVRHVDAEGRALRPFAGGIVPPGHLFLHSDFAGSYDSRYFGPVPAAGLLGLARPVLTLDP